MRCFGVGAGIQYSHDMTWKGIFLDGLGTVFMKLFYEHCGFVLYTQDYLRKTKMKGLKMNHVES